MDRTDSPESMEDAGSGAQVVEPGRLDRVIQDLGLADSRSRAQRLIQDGSVRLSGTVCTKPSTKVKTGDLIEVDKGPDYASRGAYKLAGAFEAFEPMGLPGPEGRHCLDIGASTGGFTDLLLRRGASRVVALDVGQDQLIDRIARDSRVLEMNGVNIRNVGPDDLLYRPDYVVSDVSFISLTYVIPVLPALIAPDTHCILLIKPQFEVGRTLLGHHGVVTEEDRRVQAVERVTRCAEESGFEVRGRIPSPITGAHGNIEYLLWLSNGHRP